MSLPLENIKIVLTRSESQTRNDIVDLEKLGAKLFNFPTIKIAKLDDYSETDKVLNNINNFDYLIFTSSNSVKYFFERIAVLQIQINFDNVKIIAIGNATGNSLNKINVPIDISASKFSAENLLNEISAFNVAGKKILIPGSELMRNELSDGLKKFGADAVKCAVYQNKVPEKNEVNIDDLIKFNADLFIFTSPSTFFNFIYILEIDKPIEFFKEKIIAVIGPTTRDALVEKGIVPNIIPNNYDMKNLIEEINIYYKNQRIKFDKIT